jgi:hypothetical protein
MSFVVNWRARRRVSGAVLLVILAFQNACYVYAPAAAPELRPGVRYSFDVTDQGRVGLGANLGAGVTSIEGQLVELNQESYVLSVARVQTIAAGVSHWTGEKVNLRRDFVSTVHERRFSRQRTAVAVGIALGSALAFALTRTILGRGADSRGPDDTPGPPDS